MGDVCCRDSVLSAVSTGELDCIGSLHSIFVIGEVKNTMAVPLR